MAIEEELKKSLGGMEDEYRHKEAQIAREVQAATMDREKDTIGRVQERQISEKEEIFSTLLP